MYERSAVIASLTLLLGACGGSSTDKPAGADKKAEAKAEAKGDAKDDAKAAPEAATGEADPGKAAHPELVERGRYLAEVVMNCRACHTPLDASGPELARAYAGGLEYADTFGTWRSPNITQDKKTGIGGWTDEQIVTAVREGKRPTGEQMYPVMPYQFFSATSDEDMKALVAFLRTVGPIENAVAGNTDLKLKKPEHAAAEPLDPGIDPQSRGEYLARLAHCADCHTPLLEDGSPDPAKAFAGGRKFTAMAFQGTGDVWSANITPDQATGIGKYTEDELMTAIVDLDKRDGTAIVGPMTFYVGAWSQLTHKDVKALAAYLRSLPPVKNAVPESTWKRPAP